MFSQWLADQGAPVSPEEAMVWAHELREQRFEAEQLHERVVAERLLDAILSKPKVLLTVDWQGTHGFFLITNAKGKKIKFEVYARQEVLFLARADSRRDAFAVSGAEEFWNKVESELAW